MVRRALDLGVTFIDTARAYGTEEAVGLGLKGRRDEAVISTKAGVARGDEPRQRRRHGPLRRREPGKLATDHIDVFLLHGVTLPDTNTR